MSKYANVPVVLKQLPNWVVWKYVTRDGKQTKVPFQPNGKPASSTDKSTWSTLADVVAAESACEGVGFVLHPDNCIIGVDLDGCRDPRTGKLEQWARDVIVELGSYAEVSPSGTGVKIFGSTGFRWPHRKKVELPHPPVCDKAPAIEVYDSGRYFAVTGQRLKGMNDVLPIDEYFDSLADRFGMRESVAFVSGAGIKFETPVLERASKYLAKLEPAVAGQSGHNKAFFAACVLVKGFGLNESESLQVLAAEFNPRCQPPWSEKELVHKVRSAAKQPGTVGYLRDARPEEWHRVKPVAPNWKEHAAEPEQPHPSEPELRRTTLYKAAGKYLAELASGKQVLIATGVPELDVAIGGGVAMGEMVIIAARPSHGKSAVALQMCHEMSLAGLPIVIVSEEMSALALGKRAVQFISDLPEDQWGTALDDVATQVDRHFKRRAEIQIIESCGSVHRACAEIEKMVAESGVKVAVIDYAQLLTAQGKGRYEQITAVSQQLRMLASRLQIVVIVLAQLNRSIEERKKFVPMMSDIKETGQLEQDADVILFGVWPHRIDSSEPKSKYQFFVAKNRNRAIVKGSFECSFKPHRQRLDAVPVENHPNYSNDFGAYT